MASERAHADGGPIRSREIVELARVSYRQLDYWTRRGWLHADGLGGSGHDREWSLEEFAVAVRMAALVDVGYTPPMAAVRARGELLP